MRLTGEAAEDYGIAAECEGDRRLSSPARPEAAGDPPVFQLEMNRCSGGDRPT